MSVDTVNQSLRVSSTEFNTEFRPAHTRSPGARTSPGRRLLVARVYAPHGPVSGVPQKHWQPQPLVMLGGGVPSLFPAASSHVLVPSSRSDPIGAPSMKTALGPVGHSHA